MKNYIYYNANPFNNDTQDCFVRAISKASNVRYDSIFQLVAQRALEKHLAMVDERLAKILLEEWGYKKLEPQVSRVHTVNSFAEEYKTGKYILLVNHHAVAVVDGKYYDKKDTGKRKVIEAYRYE